MSTQLEKNSAGYYQASLQIKQSQKNPDGYILSVSFAADDSIITTSLSGKVLRWNLNTWTSHEDQTAALIQSGDLQRLDPLIQLACNYLQEKRALNSPESNAENAKKLCAL